MSENCYDLYKNNYIMHASQEKLLLMILDESVKQGKIAKIALGDRDYEKVNNSLIKIQDIYIELIASLSSNNQEIKWKDDMISIYTYIYNNLIKVNFNKDINLLNEILPLISEIRDIWYEASEKR